MCAYKVRDYVGQYGGQSQSWSAVISGISEAKALSIIADFSSKKVCPVWILSTYLFIDSFRVFRRHLDLMSAPSATMV